MATSVNPILLDKQPLKSLNRSPKFLRHGYNMKGNAAKRKSAVELLQESKAFYVKSEQVLDSKQELKHSEHLQVTSNPSYNVLLRHPLRSVHSWDVSSSSSSGGAVATTTATPTPLVTASAAQSLRRIEPLPIQHHRSRSSSQIIDSKILTFTLLGPARSQIRNHQKSGSGEGCAADTDLSMRGSVRGRASVTRTGSSCRISPVVSNLQSHQQVTQTKVQESLSTLAQHQQVFVSVQSSSSSPLTKMTPKPSSKLPHSPHMRSKTQPEVPCPPVTPRPHEYRRSHSERDNSDDIQMKLRRLLNTDSKENLSSNCNSEYDNVYGVHNKNNNNNINRGRNVKAAVESWQQHTAMTNGSVEKNTFAGKTEAFIKPRHQQEGNYCIHKSMPDLSPMQLGGEGGQGRRRSMANGSNDSLSVKAPKSVDLKPPSWSTSDYVSRSPSSRRECFSGRLVGQNEGEIGGDEHLQTRCLLRSQRVDEDEDSTGAASSGGAVEIVGNLIGMQGFGSIRRRPILRSKSDISHRYSKSGNDLSATGSPKRNSRCGAELERFFDTMGLDSSVLYVLNTPPSDCSSPIFFASISTGSSSCCCRSRHGSDCVEGNKGTFATATGGGGGLVRDQVDIGSGGQPPTEGNTKDGLSNTDLMHHSPVETSIVERNARVIKWLFNCRKVLGVATTTGGSSCSSSTTKKPQEQ